MNPEKNDLQRKPVQRHTIKRRRRIPSWVAIVILFIGIASVSAFFMNEKQQKGDHMAYAQLMNQPAMTPPMDAVLPAHTETASFGLG
jgi:hypothetical protein